MKNLQRIISNSNNDRLDIRFWPTDICNFNCDYCFPGAVLNINKFPNNIGTVIKNFRLLLDEYEINHGKNFFNINVVGGGEPTLWPYLKEWACAIKESHNVNLKLTSNGSRKINWWEDNVVDIFDRVLLSFHHKEAKVDSFIELADYLWHKNIRVTALVLMDANYWQKCVDLIEYMKDNSLYNWFIEAHEVVIDNSTNYYSNEQKLFFEQPIKRVPDINWILENWQDLQPLQSIAIDQEGNWHPATSNSYILSQTNFFKGWKCDVAKESLVITHNGSITGSCQEQIFKDANINLFAEDFEEKFNKEKLYLGTITCPRQCCICQPDQHVSKWII